MTTSSCCDDFARVSRRGFLGGAVALAGATTVIGSGVLTTSPALATSAESVLVVLSMRGAHDGMSLLVPYGDDVYYQARPRIGIPADRLWAKDDGFFGLHPGLSPLSRLWNAGEMTAVHAAGLPAVNRSHFSAMEELEDADPGSSVRLGWLNRLVGNVATDVPLEGFFVGGGVIPTSLYGPTPVMAASDVSQVTIAGDPSWLAGGRPQSLHTLWDQDTSTLAGAVAATFRATDEFAPAQSVAVHTASYPAADIGTGLAEAARIIRSDVGVSVLTLDQGDWDMHSSLGTLQGGRMIGRASDFAKAISAFFDDLGSQRSKVTLVAFSEFGRRVVENSNQGLDHGYGNVMWAFGAGVRGGRFYGNFPTLRNTLDADVLVTTDYRDVLADVVEARFPAASIATVFPGLSRNRVGMMTGI